MLKIERMQRRPLVYARCVIAAGIILALGALMQWTFIEPANYLACLGLAVLASTWKLRFPGLESAVAPSFVFILVCVARFDWTQTVAMAMAQVIVQYYWRRKAPPRPLQLSFNIAALGIAAYAAHLVAHTVPGPRLLWVGIAGVTMLIINGLLVSGIICLNENRPLRTVWQGIQIIAVPYWLGGGVLAALWSESNLAALPVVVMAAISAYLLDSVFHDWVRRLPATPLVTPRQ